MNPTFSIITLNADDADDVVEPVTLDDAKLHLIISHTDDDNYIEDILIPQCRATVETYIQLALVSKIIVMFARVDSGARTTLPWAPFQSIVTMQYMGDDHNYDQVLSTDKYYVDGNDIVIDVDASIRLEYTTGYPEGNVPAPLRRAILNEIAYQYENRGDAGTKGISDAAKALANPYKQYQWI